MLQDQLECLGCIACFAHYGKVGGVFQQAAHAIAQHFVIVGDHATNVHSTFWIKSSSLAGQHEEILAYSDEAAR